MVFFNQNFCFTRICLYCCGYWVPQLTLLQGPSFTCSPLQWPRLQPHLGPGHYQERITTAPPVLRLSTFLTCLSQSLLFLIFFFFESKLSASQYSCCDWLSAGHQRLSSWAVALTSHMVSLLPSITTLFKSQTDHGIPKLKSVFQFPSWGSS